MSEIRNKCTACGSTNTKRRVMKSYIYMTSPKEEFNQVTGTMEIEYCTPNLAYICKNCGHIDFYDTNACEE